MKNYTYTPIDPSSTKNPDTVQSSGVMGSAFDGTQDVNSFGLIVKNFINADEALSSISKVANDTSGNYDFKTKVTIASEPVSGWFYLKLVKVGSSVCMFSDQNGVAPAYDGDVQMFLNAADAYIPKELRPAYPVIIQVGYVGSINKGFTGNISALFNGQFLRINPDGTIDAQIKGQGIFSTLGSRTAYFATNGTWETVGKGV